MKLLSLTVLCLLFVLLCSCGNNEQTVNKHNEGFNTYEPSPLALLMRQMADEFDLAKVKLRNHMPLPDNFAEGFEAIKTAEPTPEKKTEVNTDTYQQMAEGFLAALQQLKTADAENINQSFNLAVTNCVNCHNQLCPGPLSRINKLFIK
jgi:hypothetical protein